VGSDGKEELYDLKADPSETFECVNDFPDIAAALRSKLNEWRASMDLPFEGRLVEEDESVIRSLRDLGYF
jgi:hypothetical protein